MILQDVKKGIEEKSSIEIDRTQSIIRDTMQNKRDWPNNAGTV